MWGKFASIILRNRLYILAIIALLTVFFGYFAFTALKVDNRLGNTLPKDSPVQMDFEKFKLEFGEDGSTMVIAIQTDSLYTKRNFTKWKELSYKILNYNGVDHVISEATLWGLKNNIKEQKFEPYQIFGDPKTAFQEKSIDSIKKEIRQNPIYQGMLYNDSTNVSLLLVSLNEKFLSNSKKSKVVFEIEKLAESYSPYFGKTYFAGLPHIRVVMGKRIVNEMYIFLALSILASSLLLYLFFRSIRVVIQSNIVVFVSVIWALGSIALIGYKLSIMMALIPPLLIVIGVPNCVFLITRYHQEYVRTNMKTKALYIMIRRIGSVTFLTNLTTAVGFVTFTSSDKLAQFGIISSLNIMVVFVLSLCIIPIMASYSKPPKPRHLKHLYRVYSKGFLEYVVIIVTQHRKWVYVASIALVGIGIYGMTKIISTGNITGDIPDEDQILIDLKFIEKNFGGSIPFEVTVDYRQKSRLFSQNTLEKVEEIQETFAKDTLFSKSLSYVDFLKSINMSYHGNNPEFYQLISNREKLKLKKYFDKFDVSSLNGGSLTLKNLIDTNNTTLRIRMQMRELGSYKVADKVDLLRAKVDSILNPDKKDFERLYTKYTNGNKSAADSLVYNYSSIYNNVTALISKGNDKLQMSFDLDPENLRPYLRKPMFKKVLRNAIDQEYYKSTFTGTAVVVSEGTKYLFVNLLQSLVFAIISIAILMAFLFRSIKIIVVSMIPNIIPLLVTAGLMGYFQIPLKPSTILVFGIALGITINNAILFLAKYRQELRAHTWDVKHTILHSLKETGLGIFYTSVILFFGFIMFVFSQFGGTKGLGLLVSITILVGMVTNLIILPSLLLTFERRSFAKSFEEPYFDIYDEETDYDTDKLKVEIEGIRKEIEGE